MSSQFIPQTELKDSSIWNYMKEGYYGRGKRQYALKVEKEAEKLRKEKPQKRSIDQIISELL